MRALATAAQHAVRAGALASRHGLAHGGGVQLQLLRSQLGRFRHTHAGTLRAAAPTTAGIAARCTAAPAPTARGRGHQRRGMGGMESSESTGGTGRTGSMDGKAAAAAGEGTGAGAGHGPTDGQAVAGPRGVLRWAFDAGTWRRVF